MKYTFIVYSIYFWWMLILFFINMVKFETMTYEKLRNPYILGQNSRKYNQIFPPFDKNYMHILKPGMLFRSFKGAFLFSLTWFQKSYNAIKSFSSNNVIRSYRPDDANSNVLYQLIGCQPNEVHL